MPILAEAGDAFGYVKKGLSKYKNFFQNLTKVHGFGAFWTVWHFNVFLFTAI